MQYTQSLLFLLVSGLAVGAWQVFESEQYFVANVRFSPLSTLLALHTLSQSIANWLGYLWDVGIDEVTM